MANSMLIQRTTTSTTTTMATGWHVRRPSQRTNGQTDGQGGWRPAAATFNLASQVAIINHGDKG